jgi:long-chain acyl-CoA synthetase
MKTIIERYPDLPITLQKNQKKEFIPTSYSQFYRESKVLGMGFLAVGIERGQHVGIIADNSKEWLLCDFTLLSLGAVDVPRGCDSTAEEILYILDHGECETMIAANPAQADKFLKSPDKAPRLKRLILMESGEELPEAPAGVEVYTLDHIRALGAEELKTRGDLVERELAKGSGKDLATILYTSGTTGTPKGVMLTHYSFLFQVDHVQRHLPLMPGHILLTVLPIWHAYERAITYICACKGLALAYSRPVGSILMADLAAVRPHWMTSVPRIWEAVRTGVYRQMENSSPLVKKIFDVAIKAGQMHTYFWNTFSGLYPQFRPRNMILDMAVSLIPLVLLTPIRGLFNLLVYAKIKNKLGGRFIAGISGGGALADYIDSFFQAIGVKVLEGYGLTEAGPVVAVRIHNKPTAGTIGPLFTDIEWRILSKDGRALGPGRKGVLHLKSDHLMLGYFKQPEKTGEVLKDGWLNTGDIAMCTVNEEFKILGREKDTIVLTGGENVEPVPIEEKLVQSPYIEQAMVVGQDQKFLGVLIVPSLERVENYALQEGMTFVDGVTLLKDPAIMDIFNQEIQSLISPANGFKNFERIYRFSLLERPWVEGRELTLSQKIKRDVVNKLYKREIAGLFR